MQGRKTPAPALLGLDGSKRQLVIAAPITQPVMRCGRTPRRICHLDFKHVGGRHTLALDACPEQSEPRRGHDAVDAVQTIVATQGPVLSAPRVEKHTRTGLCGLGWGMLEAADKEKPRAGSPLHRVVPRRHQRLCGLFEQIHFVSCHGRRCAHGLPGLHVDRVFSIVGGEGFAGSRPASVEVMSRVGRGRRSKSRSKSRVEKWGDQGDGMCGTVPRSPMTVGS